MRSEARDVVNEEMETFQMQMKEHLEKGDPVIRQTQAVVTQEIKTMNKWVTVSNKKHEEQISQHREEVTREINDVKETNKEQIQKLTEWYDNNCIEVDGRLTQVKEDVRARFAQLGAVPMQRGITVEHLNSVSFNGEGEYPCLLYTSRCV